MRSKLQLVGAPSVARECPSVPLVLNITRAGDRSLYTYGDAAGRVSGRVRARNRHEAMARILALHGRAFFG